MVMVAMAMVVAGRENGGTDEGVMGNGSRCGCCCSQLLQECHAICTGKLKLEILAIKSDVLPGSGVWVDSLSYDFSTHGGRLYYVFFYTSLQDLRAVGGLLQASLKHLNRTITMCFRR